MRGAMHGPVTLFLARHGETDWNAAGRWQGQDFGNELGLKQETAHA